MAVVVDALFASPGIEPEIARAAEPVEIVPALKVLARDDEERPQDLADLRGLLGVATPSDIIMARDAVDPITHRGFHRGRNLRAALDPW